MSNPSKRGEVFWANLDPTVGSEIAKRRPVLIVSNDINNQYARTVSVLPITSSKGKIYPFEVELTPEESGLDGLSKAKANQIRTLDKSRLDKKVGKISSPKLEEINSAIKIHLDL